MNKIVCDVCGTSYPDTAVQCPICGTAKTDANKSSTGSEAGYAYVKGGRFSKANVRKRNAGQKELPRVVAPVKPKKEAPAERKTQKAPAEKPAKKTQAENPPARQKKQEQQENHSSNVILIIIAVLLVIAIIAVCAYIVKEYIVGDKPENPDHGTTQSTTTAAEQVPCTGLTLAMSSHTFTTQGENFMLSVTRIPANTTDTIRYASSDEQVATVDEKGIVTAVANGTATIFIYCGDQVAQCSITCDVGVEPGTDTQPTGPVPPEVVLELNRTEFTLTGYGSSHILYDGELDPSTITWTSSDEAVATVENGRVVAVGNGTATITAAYMDQTVTCTVVCKDVVVSDYKLGPDYGFGPDYTISVGDTINLYLVDAVTGLRIQPENLSFAMSKEGVITISETGKIAAIGTGTVTVTVTYGDLTFKATVRVTK